MNAHVKLSLICVLVLSTMPPAFSQGLGGAPASDNWAGNQGTASQGCAGTVNNPTSDVTMTENNTNGNFYIQPPSNTTTSPTEQSQYQGVTANVPDGPVQTGLMAPQATDQYGDNRSFAYTYTCGFPAPQPRVTFGGGVPAAENAAGGPNFGACGGANMPGPPPAPAGCAITAIEEMQGAPIPPGAMYGGGCGAFGGAFGCAGVGFGCAGGGVSVNVGIGF